MKKSELKQMIKEEVEKEKFSGKKPSGRAEAVLIFGMGKMLESLEKDLDNINSRLEQIKKKGFYKEYEEFKTKLKTILN
jgi:hypothetical protein